MDKKFRGDHTRYGQTSNMSEQETQAARAGRGGGFSGTRSKRTKRRQEFLAEQETHAMEAAKPLEVVSDGDLSEVKKDPEETKKAWEVWLEKKEEEKEEPKKDEDEEPNEFEEAVEEVKEQGETVVGGTALNNALSLIGLSYKSWLDNVTKPIPDSKGGRGSFQHCINANKDKKNPGGWCKQIERKIGKGKDEGEEEEVKISTYKKLTRIKDRLQAHDKARQTKIDKPKDWWDHSKVGRQGDIDQKTGRPWWEVATEEKERRKRESKEAAIPFNPKSESSDTWNCDLCNIEIPNDSDADKRKKRHADFHVDETDKPEGRHRNWTFGNAKFTLGKEKKKTDKCPGCDGEGKKWHIGPAFIAPHSTECPGCKGRGKLTPTQQQDKEAKVADDKQFNKLTDKTDYFVEEIRANIIYHNKIFPLIGMIAGSVARGAVSDGAKKVGGELLDGMGDMAKEQSEEE